MSKFYIPPPDTFFRLLGFSSDHVLTYVAHPLDPDALQVSHHPKAEVRGDQWFQLVPGRGKYYGCSAIKSKTTGKVLFSRNDGHPRIGFKAVEPGGPSAESWFRFEFGTGRHQNHFRIRNFASNTVLYSRTYTNPQVYNCFDSSSKPDKQYFSFLFEEHEIYWIDYHIDRSRILSSTPIVLVSQSLDNDSDVAQQMEFSLNEKTTHTSTFEYTLGISIDLGASFKAHLPYVAEGQVKIDFTHNHQFKWGKTISAEKTYTARLPVSSPAHSSIEAVSTVTRCELEVPFTIYSKSTTTGRSLQTPGIHRGVTTWGLRHNMAPSTYGIRQFRTDRPPDYFPCIDV